MTEYQIQPITRRCTATGQELLPGTRYFSVLLEQEGKFVRQDYSGEAWTGPPAGAFSFWAGRVPTPEQSRQPRMDDEMVHECFLRLQDEVEPGRVNFRYVLALLLMRRKRLRSSRCGARVGWSISARCSRTGTLHDVLDPRSGGG
jgi:hypothetical protein